MRGALSFLLLATSVAGAIAGLAVGCGDDPKSVFAEDAGKADTAPAPVPTGFGQTPDAEPADFPAGPIIDGDAPKDSASLFTAAPAAATGGPCLIEPEVGAMLPRNWLRPRFRWIAANALANGGTTLDAGGPQNLFELRLHSDARKNDLVVYTKSSSWTMPREMWNVLRQSAAGTTLTMTVRGGTLSNGTLIDASAGSTGPLSIAPVDAPGTIVYWSTSKISGGAGNYDPLLKGFRIGDESVRDVLKPSQLANQPSGAVKCVGCHTSTPDGAYAVTTTRSVSEGDGPQAIAFGLVDGGAGDPAYVTKAAKTMLQREHQSVPSFSKAHFTNGDRVVVSMYRAGNDTGDPFEMIWTDLEATSNAKGTGWDIFKRTGDAKKAAAPSVSHDGTKIVYVSTDTTNTSGNIIIGGKLFTVPWTNRQGGTATELAGANVDGSRQFYPAFSPDDSLVAFDRAPQTTKSSSSDPNGEIWLVPSSGGAAQRLTANDPPQCTGAKSPGVFNAWPKWSPDVGEDGGKKYYFIVFSSARNYGDIRFGARLYVTPVVVEGTKITTYSALYLWNQPENEDNHSPAWDTLKIPDEVVK